MDFKIPIFTILGIFLVLTIGFDQDVYAHGGVAGTSVSTAEEQAANVSHDAAWNADLFLGGDAIVSAPQVIAPRFDPFTVDYNNQSCRYVERDFNIITPGDSTCVNFIKATWRGHVLQCFGFAPIRGIPGTVYNAAARSILGFGPGPDTPQGGFPLGTHTLTWDAFSLSNNLLNTATDSDEATTFKPITSSGPPREHSTITVVDRVAPVLTVPADVTLEAQGPDFLTNGQSDPSNTGQATAIDVCSSSTVIFSDRFNEDPDPQILKIIARIWAGIDAKSNSVILIQVITFVDTTGPVITAPAPTVIEGNVQGGVAFGDPEVVAWLASASATDLVDGSTPVTNDALTSGVYTVGEHTINFDSSDSRGNVGATQSSTITVIDTTPPVITVNDIFVGACSIPVPTEIIEFGASASDIVDPNPTLTNDAPAEFPFGDTTVTWTSEDASGNIKTGVTQKVTIIADDPDGDGITECIDTQPAQFSDDFDESPIDGETEGTIESREDQNISILDQQNPEGIFFTVDNGGGTSPGLIVACDEAGELEVDSGDSGTITCGSITISIISGSVDVQFNTGGIPATTTMVTTNTLTFDDDDLIITNNSMTDDAVIKIGSVTITLAPGESINITQFAFPPTSKTSYQDPNLGDVRHGEGHDNGFCMNQNCINVDGFFNHFPETIVPQGSTQTFSLLINCPRGVDTCNHATIEGVLPDSDFYDEQWGVTLDRQPRSDDWDMTVNNPYGEIGEVTTTVQEVGQSFLSVSYNIEFLIPGSIGTPDGIRVPHENNRFLHVTVWDSNRGISNYIFNEGVYIDDIYAYPKVETSYDVPLEIEKLCLNENANKRYTCAFDKVREWTIKNGEKALLEINGKTQLDVLNEEFLLKFKELKQAIADEDSEKISEIRAQLDDLGSKIHNQKQ